MDKKITELAVATAPTGSELIEIVQGGVNKQTTLQDVADLAPAAGIQSVVAGTNVTVDDTDPLNPIVSASGGGGGTWGSITGTLSSQTDLQSALDAKAPIASPAFTGTPTVNGESVSPGLEVVSTTGTAISFAVPQFYASSGTPATGNVTLVTTGLIPGMVQVLYHDDSSEPTFPSDFVRLSGFYVTDTLNIIYMHAVTTTRIEYMIFQEL